jgi:phenylalanyl-tRNA synthetase beta subunit
MTEMKFVGSKISEPIYTRLQEYKRALGINSDSEAVRDILRRYLFEVWSDGDKAVIKEG